MYNEAVRTIDPTTGEPMAEPEHAIDRARRLERRKALEAFYRLAERLELASRDPERLAAEYVDAAGLAGARVRVAARAGSLEGELADLSIADGVLVRASDAERRVPLEYVRSLERLGPG